MYTRGAARRVAFNERPRFINDTAVVCMCIGDRRVDIRYSSYALQQYVQLLGLLEEVEKQDTKKNIDKTLVSRVGATESLLSGSRVLS